MHGGLSQVAAPRLPSVGPLKQTTFSVRKRGNLTGRWGGFSAPACRISNGLLFNILVSFWKFPLNQRRRRAVIAGCSASCGAIHMTVIHLTTRILLGAGSRPVSQPNTKVWIRRMKRIIIRFRNSFPAKKNCYSWLGNVLMTLVVKSGFLLRFVMSLRGEVYWKHQAETLMAEAFVQRMLGDGERNRKRGRGGRRWITNQRLLKWNNGIPRILWVFLCFFKTFYLSCIANSFYLC